MESLSKHEPQEMRLTDIEESKSSAEQWTDASMADEQWTDASMADKQPQSLIMQQSPHAGATCSHQLRCRSDLSDQSTHFPASPERWTLLRRYPEFRALQSQLSHLRIENEGLRRQLDRERRGD